MDTKWYRIRFYEIHALDLRVMPENGLVMADAYKNRANNAPKKEQNGTRASFLKPLPNLASLWYQLNDNVTPHKGQNASNDISTYDANIIITGISQNREKIYRFIQNIQNKTNK